ncbi:MAG: glycosyltransferase, partial [Streptosporangiaceae bacterium]
SRPFLNPWRREDLKLPTMGLRGPMVGARRSTVLCGFSSAVVPRPADWPENVHLTGYWFLDRPDWKPSGELEAFLAAGPPPVYVGFGSMAPRDPAAMDHTIRAALRREGLRGVLMGDPATSEDDMIVVSDVPHGRLFPEMAAVVHHGGAGTTAESLRAGVPTLVCPFFGDQPFWADRVHALGAGPAALPIGRVTVETLAAALRQAVTDPRIRENSAQLGRVLHAEDGVARACETLDVLQP